MNLKRKYVKIKKIVAVSQKREREDRSWGSDILTSCFLAVEKETPRE